MAASFIWGRNCRGKPNRGKSIPGKSILGKSVFGKSVFGNAILVSLILLARLAGEELEPSHVPWTGSLFAAPLSLSNVRRHSS